VYSSNTKQVLCKEVLVWQLVLTARAQVRRDVQLVMGLECLQMFIVLHAWFAVWGLLDAADVVAQAVFQLKTKIRIKL